MDKVDLSDYISRKELLGYLETNFPGTVGTKQMIKDLSLDEDNLYVTLKIKTKKTDDPVRAAQQKLTSMSYHATVASIVLVREEL